MAHFNWIEDITEEEWRRNTRDEVDLVFFLTKCAWPHLKTSGGTIVNTASLTGWCVFRTLGGLARATAKMGIVGMTKHLAMEGREYGMRANSISPGVIETGQTREQLKGKEWADYMLGKTLVGRLGKPEEVANVALFLASDEGLFVTGIDIRVDCGMFGEHQTRQGEKMVSNTSKLALVTGGSRGLGRNTALALAKDGVDVIITYNTREDNARDVAREIEGLGRRAAVIRLDTADVAAFPGFINTLREIVKTTWSRENIDFLVNNAGVVFALRSLTAARKCSTS